MPPETGGVAGMAGNMVGGGGNNMGPADTQAVVRGAMNYGNGYSYGDGWGGSCWWIVLVFFAMMMWGGMGQQSQCCCETKMLISETAANQRYESAMQNNALMQAIREEGAATRSQADQRYMAEQDRRIAQLEMQYALAGVVRYPMSTAYNAGYNPFCNCGNGWNCGMAA